MQAKNPLFDPQGEGDGKNQTGGVGVPVKGDSSTASSHDAPTFIDPQATFVDADATVGDWTPQRRPPPTRRSITPQQAPPPLFEVGDVLAGRYEIQQLLGEGGMGAVYKARDRELDRPVALKVIRPELAASSAMLARFKQELLLSRQVTHKNVIRIFDLGDADGVKFITMEFVEGKDLRSLIHEKKKFSPEESVEIMQQVCQALEAAHSVGVIHRDLKPQNIMRENTGRILVMDFGLARTMEGDGMTQVGALVGTMEYMSPEQALAKNLDQRSDLFTAGLILYELLTGKMPFHAESALASLIKRTQERAIPVSDHDNTIPGALSGVVSKCLETDPNLRYQSASEMLRDLDAWQGKIAGATLGFQPAVEPWGRTINWPIVTAIATVAVLAVAAYLFRGPLFSRSAKGSAGSAVSLAVLPFRNASGDSSLDWLGQSLAEMLSTDVGQSAHLRTVPAERVQQVFGDLRIVPNSVLDSSMLERIAQFTNADRMVSGRYAKSGSQIRIDATLQDIKRDRSVAIQIVATDEKDIPGAVDRLAASIRNNLALSSDVIKELQANSFQPTSSSPAALRDYSQGVQFLRDGRNLDAVKVLQSATQEDAEFALAFSRLAVAESVLGYDAQAEQDSRKAVELSHNLPPTGKYLVDANHNLILKNSKKAIEAFENLAKVFPDDTEVEYSLGSLYADSGDFDKAHAQFAKILAAEPKNIKALWQLGSVEYQRGNPQAALEPLDKGLSLAVQLNNPEQKAFILQALGIAYRLMEKPAEAIKSLQDSMEITRQLGMKRLLAATLAELAADQVTIGKPDAAMASDNQALQILQEAGAKKDSGDILINRGLLYSKLGDSDKALQDYKDALQIERDANDVNYEAVCLSNIGVVYFEKYDMDNALTYYQQSLQLRQQLNQPVYLADTLSSLADVYTAMGNYDQALASLMKAIDLYRKANNPEGAASVSGAIGKVLLYEGRLGPAVSAAQDSVNGYRSTNNKSFEMADSLNGLADALVLAGRGSEAGTLLDEASTLATPLKNESLNRELLNTRGDVAFYRGDYKAARSAYEQAAQAAAKTKDQQNILIAKMNLARVAIAEGHPQSVISQLRASIQEADRLRLKYYWLRGSVDLAEAMMKSKDYVHARQGLDQALSASEKLGTQLETAIIHFELHNLLNQTGDIAGAASQFREANALLDTIKKEQGSEHILERADLKSVTGTP